MADSDARPRHGADSQTWSIVATLGGLIALGTACGASDSEVQPPGAGGSNAGAGGAATAGRGGVGGSGGAARGGASGKAGSSDGGDGAEDAGAPGTSGSAGAGEAGSGGAEHAGAGGGASDDCEPLTTFTEAWHSVVNVTWPAGTATLGGSGEVHLWGKTSFTADGKTLSGTLHPCGSVLPPTELSAIVGGGRVLIEIPDEAWDAPEMPRFELEATHTGWGIGSTISYGYTAQVGFSMPDASTAPWPASHEDIVMTSDPDGDMNTGVTAVPRDGGGYELPPTSILGVVGGARAEEIYVVMRNVVAATLTRTACDEASGTATITHFDNHVVGCMSDGDPCSSDEVDFVDQNRTIYEVTSASTESKIVADDATCADVRAALPI